jgi:RHH-type proline utilization regulon transcriptional repressor/proline dehydrogenase/delta 1-pyrroline-5-carboxylate dehydrogenase
MDAVVDPFSHTPLLLSADIHHAYCADEQSCLRQLSTWYLFSDDEKKQTHQLAQQLIEHARLREHNCALFHQLLKEFSLETDEGVALMCLAEALIRIPDTETAQLFLEDKFNQRHWQQHISRQSSLWVNASTWGLMLSGKIFQHHPRQNASLLSKLFRKISGPIAHKAITQAISAIGDQFIFANEINQACEKSSKSPGTFFSYDLLGESALTYDEADSYLRNYYQAIDQLATQQLVQKQHLQPNEKLNTQSIAAGLSIKLSAICPRFEALQIDALQQLTKKLSDLVCYARERNVPIMLDAEECSRLEPTLTIYATLISHTKLKDWPHVGLAVQAYQKRAMPVLLWLKKLAQQHHLRLPIRLVKGAYWDNEIKYAQQYGLRDYPVFTQKAQTDVSYLSCAQFMLQNSQQFYGYFASHNAQTLAAVITKAQSLQQPEFCLQRLHGMGLSIFQVIAERHPHITQSIYAPIGEQRVLLPYLVRRLLESGANSSFLNLFNRRSVNIDELCQDPQTQLINTPSQRFFLPKPCNLYQPERQQMPMVNLHNSQERDNLRKQIQPLIHLHQTGSDQDQTIRNPANTQQILGSRSIISAKEIVESIEKAHAFFPTWTHYSADFRAKCLNKLADLIEQHTAILVTLLLTEAGKTLNNALQEIREASDYCRYYAAQCRQHFSHPQQLPGPTGEVNVMQYEGRGVMICISPWNFPLAILLGQITAALAAGNCVIAKPATRGELIARQVARLIKTAGFPEHCCYFTPCSARVFATVALSDKKIAGVCFTGSIESAQQIQRELALREGPLAYMSAETGGQNVMIVDSTALCEQVVVDAITSAFDSAGQRCSALRVLCLQNDIAQKVIDQLRGRMTLLRVGDPLDWQTDIGPVINDSSQKRIQNHIARLSEKNLILARTPIDATLSAQGYFVSPTLIEIDHINILKQEIFGPVLHVLRFDKHHLPKLIEQINGSGYGLTLGIHTRIDSRASEIAQKIRCGNIYINRNMIGAAVGSQPFGGMGLSGSGHKSGGPDTLLHLSQRKSISNNLTATGGNAALLSIKSSLNDE